MHMLKKKKHHLIVQQKAYTFYSSFSVEMQHGSDTCTEFGRVTNEQKVAKKIELSILMRKQTQLLKECKCTLAYKHIHTLDVA